MVIVDYVHLGCNGDVSYILIFLITRSSLNKQPRRGDGTFSAKIRAALDLVLFKCMILGLCLAKTLTCPVLLSSGASSATMLIFILPAVFYLKLVKKEPLRSPQKVGVSKACNFPFLHCSSTTSSKAENK